jgi:UDP-N-acetyl-D-galactosamine dehydrogenase
MQDNVKLAVIGLGYVGLPLAVEFGKKRDVIGFDIDKVRISELKEGYDSTLEISETEISESPNLTFSNNPDSLSERNFFIVSVPTPINDDNSPNLKPLESASKLIAGYLSEGDIVVYESTVYPGATEEVCVPILEEVSKLQFNKDFFVGYSPERINPGDKSHRLPDIVKIVSASNEDSAILVNDIYSEIITAGTFMANSIKVAEAAKVIENTQRDVNIGLINELSVMFSKMDIDSNEVLEAAKTKWNFIPFAPGLVGGHCIGVDPFYLTYKAQALGYEPEMILAGRKINDSMPYFVVERLLEGMRLKNIDINNCKVLIMGLSFKENCPDTRNSKVVDIVKALKEYTNEIDIYDPWVDTKQAKDLYGFDLIDQPKNEYYEAIIIAVPHREFVDLGGTKIRSFSRKNSVVFDVKNILDKKYSDITL